MSSNNIYLPYLMRIEKITEEAPGVKTFRLKFEDEAEGRAFSFRADRLFRTTANGFIEAVSAAMTGRTLTSTISRAQ